MKFEIRQRAATTEFTDNGRDGYEVEKAFWFVIVGANGEIVATSEMYTRKDSALGTIESICVAFREARGGIEVIDTTADAW